MRNDLLVPVFGGVQGGSRTSVGQPNGFNDVHGEPISAIVGDSWRGEDEGRRNITERQESRFDVMAGWVVRMGESRDCEAEVVNSISKS